jgi:hypothetical protein
VENLIPIKTGLDRDWIFGSHEECMADRQGSFDRIIGRLGLWKTRATDRVPSLLVSTPGPEAGRVRPWHSPLTAQEGEEVLEICEHFGLNLYGRQALPLAGLKEAILTP